MVQSQYLSFVTSLLAQSRGISEHGFSARGANWAVRLRQEKVRAALAALHANGEADPPSNRRPAGQEKTSRGAVLL